MAIKTEATNRNIWEQSRTYQYSDDPADVTRVWWPVASESVAERHEEWTGTYHREWYDDSPEAETRAEQRMRHVLDALAAHVADTYPNATDLWIVDGGYENQYASFSPRVETADAIPYEHGLDDMIDAEDRAIAEAFTKHPTPEGEN